jgi:hypothetical protein
MKRLRCVLVAGMVAVAVCMIGAGTAVAAKGGNSDNAHACQQGGHESRFEAETGRAFNNAGDCASHAAQGGDTAGLQIDNTSAYPCPPPAPRGDTCWGNVTGSGLQPGSLWTVIDNTLREIAAHGTADSLGRASAPLNRECGGAPVVTFATMAVVSGGQTVSNIVNLPQPSAC